MTSPACHWVRSVLTAYLDGELKPSTAKAVRRHLVHCALCRERLGQLEETWRLLDAVESPPVQGGFTERMMARIVEEKELQRLEARLRPHRLRREVLAAATGLAAGLLVGFSLYSWTGRLEEPKSPVEREVSRNVAFLEDVALMDEIGVIEAMDNLTTGSSADEGA